MSYQVNCRNQALARTGAVTEATPKWVAGFSPSNSYPPVTFDGSMYTDGKMLPPPSMDASDTNLEFRQVFKTGL